MEYIIGQPESSFNELVKRAFSQASPTPWRPRRLKFQLRSDVAREDHIHDGISSGS